MFQPDTQRLIDDWTALARASGVRGGIPRRTAFRPESLGARMPRAFLVEQRPEGPTLRVAGGWLELLHNRPLCGADFLSLWGAASRPLVAETLSQALRQARPMVVVARVGAGDTTVEVTMTPLRGRSGRPDRILGLMAPAEPVTLDHDQPCLLTARLAVAAGDPGRPELSVASVRGRRLA